MKIGIDAHMLGDRSGGNQRFYENILQNMTAPADSTVVLFVQKGTDVGAFEGRFEIVYLRSKTAARRYLWELPRLCRKLKLDILHTQYFIPFIRHCKTVCTIHDICFEQNASWFSRKDNLYQKTMIPYAAKHADHIVTVSDFSRSDIAERYGVDPERISVVYNAVDPEVFTPDGPAADSELREKYGIGDAEYVLCVGNLNPRKNLARLIRAFETIKREYGGSEKLLIVGKEGFGVRSDIDGAGEDVLFTGLVEDDELAKLYRGAACFVYPSLYEGFGIPPLEAMACGTPVAVSDRTSLPEVVGDAGLYFDPEDEAQIAKSIHCLLTEPETRARLKQAGLERVQCFDWRRSAGEIVGIYRSIFEQQ